MPPKKTSGLPGRPVTSHLSAAEKNVAKLVKTLGMSEAEVRKMIASQGGAGTVGPISGRNRGSASASEVEVVVPTASSAWTDFMDDDEGGGGELEVELNRTHDESSSSTLNKYIKVTTEFYEMNVEGSDGAGGGVLAQTGTLDWDTVGRSKKNAEQLSELDFESPTLLTRQIFNKTPISFVTTGCSSCHSICVTIHGTPYAWGRNEQGQLGNGGTQTVTTPRKMKGNWGENKIVSAAVGKSHTILIDELGYGWGAGRALEGQLGANTKIETVKSFKQMVLSSGSTVPAVKLARVACGENFTVVLDTEGLMYTCGSSEFGQLGNGETGEYFVGANKLAYSNETKLVRRCNFVKKDLGSKGEALTISDASDIRISRISCGKNHAIALEAAREKTAAIRVFTWGSGSYGCLGHKEQKDSFHPRLVETIAGPMFALNAPIDIEAGSTCCLIKTLQGHVYYWGKHRSVGEAQMYPVILDFLANNSHKVTAFGAGFSTVFCTTSDGATVSYGMGGYGELGYGKDGGKSSSQAKWVSGIDKCVVTSLSCGYGHTLFVIKGDGKENEKLVEGLPSYDVIDERELEEEGEEKEEKPKKKAKVSK